MLNSDEHIGAELTWRRWSRGWEDSDKQHRETTGSEHAAVKLSGFRENLWPIKLFALTPVVGLKGNLPQSAGFLFSFTYNYYGHFLPPRGPYNVIRLSDAVSRLVVVMCEDFQTQEKWVKRHCTVKIWWSCHFWISWKKFGKGGSSKNLVMKEKLFSKIIRECISN